MSKQKLKLLIRHTHREQNDLGQIEHDCLLESSAYVFNNVKFMFLERGHNNVATQISRHFA